MVLGQLQISKSSLSFVLICMCQCNWWLKHERISDTFVLFQIVLNQSLAKKIIKKICFGWISHIVHQHAIKGRFVFLNMLFSFFKAWCFLPSPISIASLKLYSFYIIGNWFLHKPNLIFIKYKFWAIYILSKLLDMFGYIF